jgi:hypothetical protein
MKVGGLSISIQSDSTDGDKVDVNLTGHPVVALGLIERARFILDNCEKQVKEDLPKPEK